MNRWSALAMLLAIASALALRVPKLDLRPLHNDEAVNAIKVSELWQQGHYRYDPHEYHGPTLHYATLPFLKLSSARNPAELPDAALRLAPVLFGIGLIILLPLLAGGLPSPALAWAAVFTAISPAMVFYSRYFIHEVLLVFFSMLALGAAWRYAIKPAIAWAIIAGAAVGLMFATKETFVFSLAAAAVAAFGTFYRSHRPPDLISRLWNLKHVAAALGAALLVWLIFFSSFFTNMDGLADSFRTYLPWIKRAGGHSPHIHPWYFYLERLAWFQPPKSPLWSEGFLLLLAAIGAIVAVRQKQPLPFFLVLYTLTLTTIYSLIPYKTPWCMLGFLHGIILLAGFGAAAILEFFHTRSKKWIVALILLTLTIQLASQARRASFDFPADRRNPYVYAQTLPDILNLIERAHGLARVSPSGYDIIIKTIAPESDYWPLPWYLRQFKHLGWYDKIPDDPFAPIIIVSSKLNAALDEKSDRKWIMVGLSELRPGKFFELYVELDLWKKYVETLPRPQE